MFIRVHHPNQGCDVQRGNIDGRQGERKLGDCFALGTFSKKGTFAATIFLKYYVDVSGINRMIKRLSRKLSEICHYGRNGQAGRLSVKESKVSSSVRACAHSPTSQMTQIPSRSTLRFPDPGVEPVSGSETGKGKMLEKSPPPEEEEGLGTGELQAGSPLGLH